MFPFEFLLFGATLIGVAYFHRHYLKIAFIGLAAIVLYKLLFANLELMAHLGHEVQLLINLFGLLIGFELMADQFQQSKLALKVPARLPDDWRGPFVLLCLIFVLSIFLDNIAAAMIGASLAKVVFQGKVRVGYLAAIVAASNAGGAGSVIGDTTTTMMWIDGVNWLDVTHAFLPATVALIIFGVPLSIAQQQFQAIVKNEIASHGSSHATVDYGRVLVVAIMLIGVVIGNVFFDFPALGLWAAILLTAIYRAPHWKSVPEAGLNASFLLALVLCASLMPVETLPKAVPAVVYALGWISAVFDNIPLTKLALAQGGYDWGWLAYSVGFGGSMMWFGSSAGVAVAKDNPQMRNTMTFIKESWIIAVAYSIGFASLFLLGWQPHAIH
jgi:Na+/H+ antiporter NhaD/arsenite permease-like protein